MFPCCFPGLILQWNGNTCQRNDQQARIEARVEDCLNATVSRLKKEIHCLNAVPFPITHSVAFNAGGSSYWTCFVCWVFVDHVVATWQEERWWLHASHSTSVEVSRDSLFVLGRSRLRRSSPVYRPAKRVWTSTRWRAWGKASRCTHKLINSFTQADIF